MVLTSAKIICFFIMELKLNKIARDVHQRLREKTKTYHQQIERTPVLYHLINESINLDSYHLLLKQFHAYILPCEASILTSPCSSLLDGREKTSRLINDLSDLKISNKKKCLELPPLTTREQVLGYLYVMEGATLGGQVIAKILQERLGLTALCGARYFNGYGEDTMRMWVEFCHLLNQVDVLQEEQVLVSASLTYTTLIEWINRVDFNE